MTTLLLVAALQAAPLNTAGLARDLTTLAARFQGRVGVCVQTKKASACVHPQDRFPLQSVMKLMVGFAVLDAVDTKGWHLDDEVLIRKEDLSLYVQPLAKLVGPEGYRTTIGDLVRRAVISSDSAATDVLIARMGGTRAVSDAMRRHDISGVRIDRDERHLQTEIVGLTWRPEYVDADLLERAIRGVPARRRDRAFAAYQQDARDTATPAGMAAFLFRLANGELLSETSTAFLLQAMKECVTFPDRLKAGVPASWEISHKTGTSGTWRGVTAATNDVGILRTPNGELISISAFVADSPASSAQRAAVIAAISSLVVEHDR
jgi:beta-lactamase class A